MRRCGSGYTRTELLPLIVVACLWGCALGFESAGVLGSPVSMTTTVRSAANNPEIVSAGVGIGDAGPEIWLTLRYANRCFADEGAELVVLELPAVRWLEVRQVIERSCPEIYAPVEQRVAAALPSGSQAIHLLDCMDEDASTLQICGIVPGASLQGDAEPRIPIRSRVLRAVVPEIESVEIASSTSGSRTRFSLTITALVEDRCAREGTFTLHTLESRLAKSGEDQPVVEWAYLAAAPDAVCGVSGAPRVKVTIVATDEVRSQPGRLLVLANPMAKEPGETVRSFGLTGAP